MKKHYVSELMDDALEGDEAREALSRLGRDAAMIRQWERYHLISDTLSNHLTPYLGRELQARVRAAIDGEPHYLGAQRRPWTRVGRMAAGVGLAASLVGVAVIGGQWLKGGDGFGAGTTVARITTENSASAVGAPPGEPRSMVAGTGMHWDRVEPGVETRLNGFLVSHSTYADSMSPIRPYARVISYHGAP
ncbi:MAG: RseA family anti-sigma factor [Gammaproteobacteria bacterium]|nr:RseA family anti-sigma factor [Gammaproteobacteria bacterium]